MKYSEIFTSIQGEGRYVGVPSQFIRLSYCNLRCSWCDTPYTSWSPENKDITVDEIVVEVEKNNHIKHIVITGGEPMLQRKELKTLCDELRNYQITIETNGCYYEDLNCDLMSISPKLSNSTPIGNKFENLHETNRINLKSLELLIKRYNHQIKFVVCTENDLKEIIRLCDKLSVKWKDVYLMSEGRSKEELNKKSWLIQKCIQLGFNYSHRLHIDLWGNKRGV